MERGDKPEYEVRCAVKTGPRRGQWVAVASFCTEENAWNYCLNNKNRLGMLEMWRVINPWEGGKCDVRADTLHSIHYGTPAKQVKVTIVG